MPPSGSFFPVGTSTVTCTATDAAGNTSECSFTVTVRDEQRPQITCPENIVAVTTPDQCSAVIDYSVTATDNCAGVTVVSSPPSGSIFPKGTTTVTATATDAWGNSSTCTFTVTVLDTQAPEITDASASRSTLWPPNHRMVDVTINYGVTDNCTPSSAIVCTLAVTSNEPINGTGDGDTAPDWQVLDSHRVRLRAERAGGGNGRVYTITITCMDAEGNVSKRNVRVSVPHNAG